MVLGTFGNVFAAAATDKKEVPKLTSTNQKVQWLIDNKIVIGLADDEGKETGNMDLDSPIRRDAVAKMLVYAIGEQDLAAKLQGLYRPFPDVTVDSIVNGYISVGASKSSPANGLPFIEGYNEDGTFRPQREVSYAELAKMLVVLVKEDLTKDMAYKANRDWASTWMRWAAQEGILDGVSVADEHAKAPRKDAFAMIYNAFYKLRTVKPVPTNETRGIISKKSVNYDLVLNQGDFEKKFKVTNETVFVREGKNDAPVKWLDTIKDNNDYYVGSLVRVLSDKDGNATHIIEMGNPVVGYKYPNTAWVDLGNETLTKAQSFGKKGDVIVKGEGFNKLDKIIFSAQNKEFVTTDKTVYYVADFDNNVLTQMKDKAEAAKYVSDKTQNVYLAYEVLPKSGVKEAKVVVFNNAKNQDTNDIVRVEKAVSRPDFMLSFQKPGYNPTTIEQVDLRKIDTVWPYNYNFTNYDVIDLAHRNGELRNGNVLIDYETDPIFQVKEFQKIEGTKVTEDVTQDEANAIVLLDKDNQKQTYDFGSNVKKFFGKEITKGAKVQIKLVDDVADNNIKIISVVKPTDGLRGNLPNGKYIGYVEGTVQKFIPAEDNSELNRVLIIPKDGKVAQVYVTALEAGEFPEGSYIEFRAANVNINNVVGEIVEVTKDFYKTTAVDDVKTLVAPTNELSQDEVDAYVARIADANNEKEAQAIVDEAKANNAVQGAVLDSGSIKDAKDAVEKLPDGELKTDYENALAAREAITAYKKAANAGEETDKLYDAAKAAIEKAPATPADDAMNANLQGRLDTIKTGKLVKVAKVAKDADKKAALEKAIEAFNAVEGKWSVTTETNTLGKIGEKLNEQITEYNKDNPADTLQLVEVGK